MKIVGATLIIVGLLLAGALVPILFLGSSYPTASLITPLVCGSGDFQILSETSTVNTSRGTRPSTAFSCVNPTTGETVELASLLLILAIVPAVVLVAIGATVYNAGTMFGKLGFMETQRLAQVPEVKAQLDALMEDFKANRISYEDYMAMSRNIMENYKARQTT